MLPSPDHGPLMALVMAADADLSASGIDGAVLRVSDLAPPGRSLNWTPLDGAHPLEVLMGFRAPRHWRALGVWCTGRAHRLDHDGRPAAGRGAGERVAVTLLVDREGASEGVIRTGEVVKPLRGRPEGSVADACRRAFGLPTFPPPRSTLGLWTLAWLDRVVDVASRSDAGSRLETWADVAALHAAAASPTGGVTATTSPVALAASALALAEAWPWARLREDPAVVEVPGGPPPARLTAWMDDGMWARWLLSRLPGADDLMAAVHALLPVRLAGGVDVVARAAWDGR